MLKWMGALLVFCSATMCIGPAWGADDEDDGPQAARWQELRVPEAGAKMLFPGKPQRSEQMLDTAVGKQKMVMYIVEAGGGDIAFMFAYNEIPAGIAATGAAADRVLDGGRDGMINAMKGEVVRERKIDIGGHPGRFVIYRGSSNNQEFDAQARFFIVGSRLIQLQVLAKKGKLNVEDANKFFQGFQLTAGRAAPGGDDSDEPPAKPRTRPKVSDDGDDEPAPKPRLRPKTTDESDDDAPAAGQWQALRDPKSRFAAQFPSKPKYSTQELDTAAGKLTMHQWIVEVDAGKRAFLLIYADFPGPAAGADPKTVLDAARDGGVNNIHGELVQETSIKIDGHPGREFTVRGKAGDTTVVLRVRIYLVGSRLYQLQAVAEEGLMNKKEADKFFASFKLEPEDGDDAPPPIKKKKRVAVEEE